MELFIIHCTTCKARLKVKDESVIGDILACPKCSSMVHVVPPVGWKRSTGPQEALAESAKRPSPGEISKSRLAKDKAAVVVPPLPVRAAPAPIPAEIQPHAVVTAVRPLPPARPSPSAADTVWTAAIARVKQDWMLYSGGLAAGVLLGAAGFWLAVSTAKTTPPATPGESPRAQAMLAPATPVAKQASPPPAQRDQMVALKPSTVDEANDPGPPSAPVASEELGEPAANALSHESSVIAETPAQDAATSEPALALPKPVAPALKLDPAPAPNSAAESAPSDRTIEPATAADATGAPDEPSKIRPMATIDPTSTGTAASERAGGSLSVAEIEARLSSSELSTVQFVQVPLSQFVEFIGDLTALKITIDDEALKAVGKGRQSPLSVKLTKTTAGKALSAGLKSLGLTCVARDGKLVITTKPPGAPQ
ncbi:MAG: hypothetical protein HY288_04590 [Planctomycetia bacterium]|nr:hypothetical protein [Planctomycetia bacterium]